MDPHIRLTNTIQALDFIASDELKSEIQAGLARARASRISGV